MPGEMEWEVRVLCHLSLEERRRLGLNSGGGIVIQAVSATAQAAGVCAGEAIVEVNGTPTLCLDDYCRVVRRWRESPEDVARLTVRAHGTSRLTQVWRQEEIGRSSPH